MSSAQTSSSIRLLLLQVNSEIMNMPTGMSNEDINLYAQLFMTTSMPCNKEMMLTKAIFHSEITCKLARAPMFKSCGDILTPVFDTRFISRRV
jgi:hypothetical protein